MTLHLVPAGVEAYSTSSAQLWVSYKKSSVEKTFVGPLYKKWVTRDKVIVLAVRAGKVVLPKTSYDQSLSVFSASFLKTAGFKILLANPVVGKEFNKAPFALRGLKSIVDSGGFQLLKEAVDFVSPDDVIKRYNANADIGMPLDVPLPAKYEPAYFNKVSNLIRANDNYILSKLAPGIELALISHGTTLAQRKARLDVLDRPAKVVAIAGLNIQPEAGNDKFEVAIENLMYVISRYRKTTEYFHILGVTSKMWMFIYALMTQSGYVRRIGADSVSHRMSALVGEFETLDFNKILLFKDAQYRIRPSCSCPVCSTVGDLRIMHEWRILESHNLWVKGQQIEVTKDMAEGYMKGAISLEEIHKVLRISMPFRKFASLVSYVQDVMANKFRRFTTGKTRSLFGSSSSRLVTSKHFDEVIKRYEKFHQESF
jgi:hypothetical protein